MHIIKRNNRRRRSGAISPSVQKDIERLQNHDWSDPLLEKYFATVVEKLVPEPDPSVGREDPEEACPPSADETGRSTV